MEENRWDPLIELKVKTINHYIKSFHFLNDKILDFELTLNSFFLL